MGRDPKVGFPNLSEMSREGQCETMKLCTYEPSVLHSVRDLEVFDPTP